MARKIPFEVGGHGKHSFQITPWIKITLTGLELESGTRNDWRRTDQRLAPRGEGSIFLGFTIFGLAFIISWSRLFWCLAGIMHLVSLDTA